MKHIVRYAWLGWAGLLLALLAVYRPDTSAVAAAPAPQGRERIKCESINNRENFCGAAVGGNVRITRQISDTPCVEGRNWRWNPRGITVWGGCRADFEFDTGGDRNRLKCESIDQREEFCPATIRGNVRVTRQISDTPCIEGRNWRWSARGITVWGGCRADFEFDSGIATGPGRPGGPGGDERWTPLQREYYDSGYRRGQEDFRAGRPRNHQRYQGSDYDTRFEPFFREGYGDGFDGRPRRYSLGRDNDRPPIGGRPGARVITCESRDGRYAECEIGRNTRVRLARILSQRPCTEGASWGYARNGHAIWVDKGCRAEFEVTNR